MTHGADTLCTIGQYDYTTTASCTFDLTAYSDEEISVAVDTDNIAGIRGDLLTITFDDGSTAMETWSGDTSFDYAHVGDELLEQEASTPSSISDPGWGRRSRRRGILQRRERLLDRAVRLLDGYYDSHAPSPNRIRRLGAGHRHRHRQLPITEGQMDITFPDGTTTTYVYMVR